MDEEAARLTALCREVLALMERSAANGGAVDVRELVELAWRDGWKSGVEARCQSGS